MKQDEIEYIAETFEDPSLIRTQGLVLDGITYDCLRSDEDSIYSKCVRLNIFVVVISTLNLPSSFFLYLFIERKQKELF